MDIRIEDYEFFREATLKICGSLHPQESADAFRAFISGYMPCDEVFFAFFDEVTSSGIFLAVSTDRTDHEYISVVKYTNSEWNDFRDAVEKDGPVHFENDFADSDEIYRVINKMHGIDDSCMSGVILNLEMNETDIGLLVISSHYKNSFNDYHLHLLSLLHDPVAIAIANWKQHLYLMRYQQKLKDDCRFYQEFMRSQYGQKVIGSGRGLKKVMDMVAKVAKTGSPVMILGETGVGKEIIANAIHDASNRSDGPFIKVNCGAIPDNLIDSELFGHEKGAFTGAVKSHRGRFERASGGTLFLDEVGELPLQAQVRLLRVIQNQELERVGGVESIPIDVRVISATNRDLEYMVRQGSFRQDLWFRLNVFPISIPPLRERKDDIPDLAHHFAAEKCVELQRHEPWEITESGITRLKSYSWPGNVRELQNVIERELILNIDGKLDFKPLLPSETFEEELPEDLVPVEPLDIVVSKAIKRALKEAGGRVQGKDGAADLLKVNPNTLRGRMKKLGIPYGMKKR